MKKLNIPFIPVPGVPSPREAVTMLEVVEAVSIGVNSWPQYTNDVEASFSMAHNGHAIFLKYDVSEDHVVARATTHGEIHRDSCVEFFVSFDGDDRYYNLEFNCLGWCKAAYGRNRQRRQPLPTHAIHAISSSTTLEAVGLADAKQFRWQLTLVIPAASFCYHDIPSFRRLKARGNMYKCGDGLPTVHYLSWNPLRSETPNFHRAEDFGQLEFGG